jgi:cephalosporin hydroxylase
MTLDNDKPIDFDETWYVNQNPDVAKTIGSGGWRRGLDHYLAHGRREGRLPSPSALLSSGEEYRALSHRQTQLSTLDELGIKRVTDKCSLEHDYLRKYERLFRPFRDLPITVLEIGVFDGGSLHLWEDYFSRATIVGIDINRDCKKYEGGRRIVEIASQADETVMKMIGARYTPTIIIDDGSHRADHILSSFDCLYPTLRSGGIYIVEDLGMHTGESAKSYRGAANTSPQEVFLKLANRVCCPVENVTVDSNTLRATEAVEFLYGFAVIKKLPAPEDDPIRNRRSLVESLDSAETWSRFASFILNNGGSPAEAVHCAERAVALAPESALHHHNLSRALEAAGRHGAALAAAKKAVELWPHNTRWTVRIDTLSAMLAGAA